jgi:RNA polymerase sigma-70 factor (ECF subfamily)
MSSHPSDDFVRALTRSQERLYAFIRSLLPNADAAREVLQETNVVMLRKFHQCGVDQEFEAWACQVARFEVLAFLRDRARDRHLFDPLLVELLATEAETATRHMNQRTDALEDCLSMLPVSQRDLLAARYRDGASLKDISRRLRQSAQSVATRLFRLRQLLFDCVTRRLRAEA